MAAAVRAICDFHELGRAGPRKPAHTEAYGRRPAEAAAARGLNPDTARKARRFADPAVGYSPAELRELCGLIQATQPDQDDAKAVFGRTHLIRLLSVPKPHRTALQKAAVEGGWSTAELELRIAARFGSRRAGGRRRRLPADGLGVLAQLDQFCEGWRRWVEQLKPAEGRPAGKRAASLDSLPPGVRQAVEAADVALVALHAAATAELAARRPGRSVRHRFRGAEGGERKPAAGG